MRHQVGGVEKHGVTVPSNAPSSKDDKGGEAFAKRVRGVEGGGAPPVDESVLCRRNHLSEPEAREHAVPYLAGERAADQEVVDRLEGLVTEDAGRAVGKPMVGAALRGPATVEGD